MKRPQTGKKKVGFSSSVVKIKPEEGEHAVCPSIAAAEAKKRVVRQMNMEFKVAKAKEYEGFK